jgi:Ser/Thr protein kinase RdoA (MazF antagonist)
LTTERGRWLAVTVYPWIDESQAELGAQLRDAAVAAGINAPTPVRSPEGRLIESVQGESWRVHEWVQVGPSPVLPTPVAVARRVGSAYGILHSLAIPSTTPVNPYMTARGSDEDWERLLERGRVAQKPWAGQLAASLPVIDDLRTIDAAMDEDAIILCNCNLIPDHVRTGRNDELVITEWDFAGSHTAEFELAGALTQWTLRPSINRNAVTVFRAGYVDAAGNWPELRLESFTVAVTGYLNWTYNTICEAITPADADHATYADLETLDVLNRPMTRAALEKLLTTLDA